MNVHGTSFHAKRLLLMEMSLRGRDRLGEESSLPTSESSRFLNSCGCTESRPGLVFRSIGALSRAVISLERVRIVARVVVLVASTLVLQATMPSNPWASASDLKVVPDVSRKGNEVQTRGHPTAPPPPVTETETQESPPEQDKVHVRPPNPTEQEETRRMLEVIYPMNRESAAMWLSSFISAQPLNCPLKSQSAWVQAILDGVERNRIPMCREIVGLVATLIAIESSFRVDPLAVDVSRGESLKRLLERTEYEFMEKYGPLVQLPGVHYVYLKYRDRYLPKLAACHTEGEVDAVARDIATDLARDASAFPGPIRNVIREQLNKLVYVVRTKGSMQLNFTRAKEVMKDRGEQFTDGELVEYMYTLHGGIDVGIAALKPMFVQYAAHYGKPDDMSWLFFVGMDYHYGPFSSRNMMEQIRIRDLSGQKIAIDGDLLFYDDKGRPADRESETLKATRAIFPRLPRLAIVDAFLLEKKPQFIYSDLHQSIVTAHRQRFGDTPFAVIGDLRMGHNAQLKHGATWRTRSYLHKLDRFLNALPWDRAIQ